jgi:hypothetical protein
MMFQIIFDHFICQFTRCHEKFHPWQQPLDDESGSIKKTATTSWHPHRIPIQIGIRPQRPETLTMHCLLQSPKRKIQDAGCVALRTKVAMHTTFSEINKLSKFANALFATSAYFNDNRLASCSYFLCRFVFYSLTHDTKIRQSSSNFVPLKGDSLKKLNG